MVNIAILGFGVVGSGVFEVIKDNSELLFSQLNDVINVKYVLDKREFKGNQIESYITKNINDILEDDSVKIIIEVMGGINPAYDYVKNALLQGKHVVTSNKELVAEKGAELLEIAKQNKINFLFEASVCGAIPIIRNIKDVVVSDKINEITGIFNGTTNYILTKMLESDLAFKDALKEAQNLGFAEQDPSNDIKGYDTVRKLSILLSLVSGKNCDYKDIETTGIEEVSKNDIIFCKKLNYKIKLIAHAKRYLETFTAFVAPVVLSTNNVCAVADGSYNTATIKGEFMDTLMFYGQGAGKLPTATAIVSGICLIYKNIKDNLISKDIKNNLGYYYSSENLKVINANTSKYSKFKYFVRLSFSNLNNLEQNLEIIKKIFAKDFNKLEFIFSEKIANELVFITEKITYNDLNALFLQLPNNINVCSYYRFE